MARRSGGAWAALGGPAALLLGLGWIFRPLFSDHGYADRDLVTHYYPIARLRAATLQAGNLFPGWNPLLNGGMPYAADPLNGVCYPPAWLLGWVPDVAVAFTTLVLLHRALLTLFTYRLARTLGMARSGAATAGAVLGLGGTTLSIDALQFLYAYTWIPLYLDQLIRWARGGSARGRFLALSGAILALLLTLLAGEPQTFYVLVLLTPLWLLVAGAGELRFRAQLGARFGRSLAVTATVAAGALLLGAGTVLPLSELSAVAHRGVVNDYAAATVWSVHPWRWLDFVLVRPFGVPEPGAWTFWAMPLVRSPFAGFYSKSHYLGVIFAALAISWPWLTARAHRRWCVPLSGIAGLGFLLAMGDYLGLYAIPYHLLPRFNLFRFPERLLMHVAWPLALLAGFAVDGLGRTRDPRFALRLTAGILAAALVFGVASVGVPVARIAAAAVPDQVATASAVIRVTLVAALRRSALVLALYGALVGGLLLWARSRAPRTRKSPAVAPMALAALAPITFLFGLGELVTAQDRLLRFMPNAILRAQPPLLTAIAGDPASAATATTAATAATERPPRLYARLQEFNRAQVVNPLAAWQFAAHNVPLGFELGTLTGYNSLELKSVVDFAQTLPLERVAAVLGVQYLVTTPADTAAARFQAIYRAAEPAITAYRLPPARRPVQLIERVRYAPTAEAQRARVAAPDFDPLRETVLLGDRPPLDGEAGGGGTVTPISFAFDRVEVKVTTPDSAAVVLTEVAYPGWTAQIDDGPLAPTTLADGVVQGTLVPPGEHVVRFAFQSRALQRGVVVSAIAWLALFATGIGLALRGRRG